LIPNVHKFAKSRMFLVSSLFWYIFRPN
jgi:hypothetical protein